MPKHKEQHKQISICQRENICGWVVTLGRRSRFFSKMSLGEGYEDIARRYYAILGIKMGYFYPPSKANHFFVKEADYQFEKPKFPIWNLYRYALSQDGYYTKIEIFRTYRTKDAKERAIADMNQLNKQFLNGQFLNGKEDHFGSGNDTETQTQIKEQKK